MFVADDLEQIRGESASSELVRFLLIAFDLPLPHRLYSCTVSAFIHDP